KRGPWKSCGWRWSSRTRNSWRKQPEQQLEVAEAKISINIYKPNIYRERSDLSSFPNRRIVNSLTDRARRLAFHEADRR
ncbi:hypothetical protein, partial [Mesorhizobium sp. M00.F.Ca.ET.216.01.1.1]|uniref:hypothetical protein n=1 Tax=Mesorhizobium sp. M00.F.Ca.ET.216.01.1.1 TaxID=2500528 RepID=UPI001AEED214